MKRCILVVVYGLFTCLLVVGTVKSCENNTAPVAIIKVIDDQGDVRTISSSAPVAIIKVTDNQGNIVK